MSAVGCMRRCLEMAVERTGSSKIGRRKHRCSQSFFFFQAEDGIRYLIVTGVQTCALPISASKRVLALTSTRELFGDAIHRALEQRFELGAGVAVNVEVPAEGIAHLGLVPLADRKSVV